jgi:heme/copper-type cytochrome/quinol oxidase subunit 2
MEHWTLIRRLVTSVLIGAAVAVLTADFVASAVRKPPGPVSADDRWRVEMLGGLVFLGATIIVFIVIAVLSRRAAQRNAARSGP